MTIFDVKNAVKKYPIKQDAVLNVALLMIGHGKKTEKSL